MYVVMTNGGKEDRLHLRIRPDVKTDLRKLAEANGLNISAFINHLIHRAIREEKESNPATFKATIRNDGTSDTDERLTGEPPTILVRSRQGRRIKKGNRKFGQ